MSARTVVFVVDDQVAIYREWPAKCTATARTRPRTADPSLPRGTKFRCSQVVMHYLPGAPELVDVEGGRLEAVVVAPEVDGRERLLAQRCPYHGDPSFPRFAELEWEPFEAERPDHRALLVGGEP